jgi:hypothetical protein
VIELEGRCGELFPVQCGFEVDADGNCSSSSLDMYSPVADSYHLYDFAYCVVLLSSLVRAGDGTICDYTISEYENTRVREYAGTPLPQSGAEPQPCSTIDSPANSHKHAFPYLLHKFNARDKPMYDAALVNCSQSAAAGINFVRACRQRNS